MSRAMPVVGDRIQDLLLEAEIGRGAFATVYRARDTLIGRAVALKVLHDVGGGGQKGAARHMLREARLVGGLDSPYVVTLYRVHALDRGDLMFEMEYVEGCSLEHRLLQGTLRTDEAQHVIEGVLRALCAAHSSDVVHRDIKPGNVLIRNDGAVKLADFGLGRLLTDEHISSQSTADAAGTPAYMAPEVFTGSIPSPASDVWSVGVLMFRVLTGRFPYDAKNLPELFIALSTQDPDRLGDDVPKQLRAACTLCLQREPGDRGTAAEVLAVLADTNRASAPVISMPTAPEVRVDQPIGRKAEVARFGDVLAAVESGASKLVLLSGDVGTGKTSLLHEVRRSARAMGMEWVDVAVSPVGGLVRPLLQALRHALAIDRSQDAVDVITSERFGDAASFLRDLLSTEMAEVQDRQRLVWAIEHLVREMASVSPITIALDDMHLANTEDLRFLLDLARNVTGSAVLLVAALRPWDLEDSAESSPGMLQVLQDLHTTPTVEHVELNPLDESAVYELLRREAGGVELDLRASDVIVRKAEGNPLYAIEMLRDLQAAGDLTKDGDQLRLRSGWDAARLPRRFRDLVTRRLAGLADDDRMLVDVAAVDGVEFDGPALCAVLQQPLLRVLQTLQRLHRQHGLVGPTVSGFRFTHILYRDVIYNEISPELQQEIHRLLAQHLSERDDGIDAARLGLHWERAGDVEKARPLLLQATGDAIRREEKIRALDLARGAMPKIMEPEFVHQHADLMVAIAGVRADLGRKEEALAVVDELLNAAEALGDEQLRLRAVVLKNDLEYWSGGVSRLNRSELERAAQELPDCRERGLAYHCLAREALSLHDDAKAAQVWIDKADRVYQDAGLVAMHASALDYKATLAFGRGEADLSDSLYAEASEICATQGRRVNGAVSQVNRATLNFDRGRLEGLEQVFRHAILVFSRHGASHSAGHTSVHLARLYYSNGLRDDSNTTLDEAERLLARNQVSRAILFALYERAAVLGSGCWVKAMRACLLQLDDVATKTGFSVAVLRARMHEAILESSVGNGGESEDALRAAIGLTPSLQEAPRRADFCARVSECVLLGAPVSWISYVRPVLDLEPKTSEEVPGVLDAAEALTDPTASPEVILRAADALRAETFGERRAERAAIGHWLESEARFRMGDESTAMASATRAMQDAKRLGCVWVELAALRAWIPRVPNDAWSARRTELLTTIGDQLEDDEARARLTARWT